MLPSAFPKPVAAWWCMKEKHAVAQLEDCASFSLHICMGLKSYCDCFKNYCHLFLQSAIVHEPSVCKLQHKLFGTFIICIQIKSIAWNHFAWLFFRIFKLCLSFWSKRRIFCIVLHVCLFWLTLPPSPPNPFLQQRNGSVGWARAEERGGRKGQGKK